MTPPQPKPTPGGRRETIGGRPSSGAACSSGGGVPPNRRGKVPGLSGGGTPSTSRSRGKAATAATDLSNPSSGTEEPGTTTSTAAEPSPRVAREKNRIRAMTSASSSPTRPRDPCPGMGRPVRSACSSCRRSASLSINGAASRTGSSPRPAPGSTSAHGSQESAATRRRVMEKAGTGLGVPRSPRSTVKASTTGSSLETPKHRAAHTDAPASNAETARKNWTAVAKKDCRKKRIVHSNVLSAEEERQMMKNVEEAERAIQQLNELGLGEDISYEECAACAKQLPRPPPHVDISVKPDRDQLDELQVRNILYRIKFIKLTRQMRKNGQVYNAELEDDHPLYQLEEKLECLEEDVTKMKGDHLLQYLHEEGLLREIENDDIFDWSFLDTVAGLDDYQRLVPQNYGGYAYKEWATYRGHFHSYEIELEYLKYWEELVKELKWMENYVLMKRPSLIWGKICTRGCYQAIKIASRFSKISEGLARCAYYDCIDSMCVDICWYKELDGVYFEIWQRINRLKMGFRDALDSVYKLSKFPLQHRKMKNALENDEWAKMEREFRTCTTDISWEMTEDIARELIADAIKNQRERPKVYAQYIKKKIKVARIIGLIPAASA